VKERVVARAIWSGSISFGLINIPVKLFSAVSEKTVRFNQIDVRNQARIRNKRVNAETGEEVEPDDIVKGYEIHKGEYVLVTDDELASLQPRATHTIDLDEFVELDEIDPIFFHGAYHVAPEERAAKSYVLLVEAMEQANKVAIARFVMRSKQYVAALRPRDGRLTLSMMVYEDEVNAATEIPEFDALEDITVTDRELAMAEQLIDSLSAPFEPERFHDSYREELLDLIHAKSDGVEIVSAPLEAPSDDTVIDLMAALEASVSAAKEARGRHPTAMAEEETSSERSAPAHKATAKSTTRKATAKKPAAKAATKAGAKKAPAKKAVAKKATTAKKAAATKRTAKKAAAPVRKSA
jgi:DNA end-binding protein Ku